jgi:hypothetical protein
MRKIFFLLLLILFTRRAVPQGQGYVQVTGTKACYANGSTQAAFVNQSTTPQLPLLNGSVFPTTGVTNMNSAGTFSFFLADNQQIFPTPSQWSLTVCGKSGGQPFCGTTQLTITAQPGGAPQDISSNIAAFPCSPGTVPPSTSSPPENSIQGSDGNGGFISDPTITIDKTNHAIHSPNFDPPNSTRGYQNTSFQLDAVADCGEVGDAVYSTANQLWTGTDNCAARTACLAAHPLIPEFFPPRYWTGTADRQAAYYSSCTTNVSGTTTLLSTNGTYQNSQGAILAYNSNAIPFGVNLGQSGHLEKINVEGNEPASVSSSDGYNIIFPSGQALTEYWAGILSINVTSGILTLNFNTAVWWIPNGIIHVLGIPAPNANLNGYYYVQTVRGISPGVGAFANVTLAAPGAANVATTTINGTCSLTASTGCIMPATSGASTSVGAEITGSFASLDNVFVKNFGRSDIEIQGSGSISDDPYIFRTTTYGSRGHGLYVHGGDSNQGTYLSYVGYFDAMYCVFDVSFLSSAYYSPQCSYAAGYANPAAGPAQAISAISRTVSGNVNTVSVTTATPMPHISVGNAVTVLGVSDTSFNAPSVTPTTTSSGFVSSVTDASHFSFIQPGYGLSAGSSSGGTVQISSRLQAYTAAAFDTGYYTVGRNNGAANYALINPYNEGGPVAQPDGCGNKFNRGVIIINSHFGNCTDANWPASNFSASSLSGMVISPFAIFNSNVLNPTVNIRQGGGVDSTNSLFNVQDVPCNQLVPCNLDWRYTNPGQRNNRFGVRATSASDQAGMINYAMLIAYGQSDVSGQNSTLGAVTFTGTGLNDMTATGAPTQNFASTYTVRICGTAPDQFCWSSTGNPAVGGASALSTPINITGAAQVLRFGLSVTFAATSGHTLNDQWTFPITQTNGNRPSVAFPNGIQIGNTATNGRVVTIGACQNVPTATNSPNGQWFAGDVCFNTQQTVTNVLLWQCAAATAGPPSTCTNWVAVPNGN